MAKQQITDKKKYFILFISIMVFVVLIALLLNSGFLNQSNKVETPKKTFTMVTTGDIGLVRDINYKIIQNNDPNYPFLNISDYLRKADLTLINLEGPLINNCPIILEGFTFCGEDENVLGLVFSGVDAASLANNHTTNYGLDGLGQTADTLKKNNITPFGLEDEIKFININGNRIALIGFVELGNNWGGLTNATVENVSRLNREAKSQADIVIDAFHWGAEYTYKPTENQVLLAHSAIDSGADIILGNHPHWIQPIEYFNGKIIIYAQGNTIFDQDWSQETREGVLYKFLFDDGSFRKIDEKFTIIEYNSQPRFATKDESLQIKRKVEDGKN